MTEGAPNLFGIDKSTHLTIKEHVMRYLAYWPLFLASLIICITAGFTYLRYATPIYKATTLILVKGEENNGGARNTEDLIRTALEGGSSPGNLDNEIQLLTSAGLMERVTAKNNFNISCYKLAQIRRIDLYKDLPFQLTLVSYTDSTNDSPVDLTLSDIGPKGGTAEYGADQNKTIIRFNWNKNFTISGKTFLLSCNRPLKNIDGKYLISWVPVTSAAQKILSNLTVAALDKKTSILKLEILSENLKYGQDVLNAIFKEFNLSYLEEKNAISERTARFIDERLAIVSNELSGVEGNLETYRGNNQMVNVTSQSALSFENENDVSKSITGIMVQQGIVKMIQDYFNGTDNKGKLVPSSLGINDATLASLIANYNELQLQKESKAPSLAAGSLILKDLNNQISNLRTSILENLQNITKNLQYQESRLQQTNIQQRQYLSAIPHKERVIQEIKRKQSITEGLYLYLLQKREENSISASSSNVSIYKQIDAAKGSGPVAPNTRNIQLYSIAFGLLIPIGIIRLRDLLNDKITKRSDITARVQIPVIGELSHVKPSRNTGIVVQSRELIAEQFRLLRTNLSFISASANSQVIMTTSSVTSEGKSFISLNLAAVLAAPGNKVALLEFDMRMPAIIKMIDGSNKTGLAEYLGEEVNGIENIRYEMENMKNLHVYPAGKTPAHVADLLLSKKLPEFIETLKQHYKYIIIDTAPAGLVTDAFILGKYANIVVYVVRQNKTLKKQLENINEIYKAGKFSNMCIVFNDIRTGARYGTGYENQKAYDNSYGKNNNRSLSVSKKNGFNKKLAV
ncbi:MAG TPA: polysaccharide biosynthesis tyrosine autokinase [Niastella sp.]